MPLASKMREAIPEALQPWYCDDAGAAGKTLPNACCLDFLVKFGLQYGYFPEPGKSYYICKAKDEDVACQAFESFGLEINYLRGQCYLGGFIGSAKKKEMWLAELVEKWVVAVQTLSIVAERYPQTVYAGLTFCLQNELQYVQRVVADTAPFFSPLRAAINTRFLPALIGIPSTEIDGKYRQLLTHSIKLGELAIRNPVDTAPSVHMALIAATCHLTASLVDAQIRFDLGTHRQCVIAAGQTAQKDWLQNEQIFINHCGRDKPSVVRRDKQNCAAGAWLLVLPNRLNGTGLLADEWRDNVCLRYNNSLLDVPTACNGCGTKMTVEHALSCKMGGLVHIRHDDVADEWRHLCGTALSPSRVECKPRFFYSVSQRVRVAAGDTTTPGSSPPTTDTLHPPAATEEQGDAGCHGFWERGRTTIFDMRITDTDT